MAGNADCHCIYGDGGGDGDDEGVKGGDGNDASSTHITRISLLLYFYPIYFTFKY